MGSSGRQAPSDRSRIFGAPVVSKRLSTLRGHHQGASVRARDLDAVSSPARSSTHVDWTDRGRHLGALRSGGSSRPLPCSTAAVRADEHLSCRPPRWLPNAAVFGLWFWEVDRGDPHMRPRPSCAHPSSCSLDGRSRSTAPGRRPALLDYLDVAFTNATAFSPTDAMPLSEPIRCLMLIASITSLLAVGLVAARALNILHM